MRYFWILLLPLGGCFGTANPPITQQTTLPPNTASVCSTHCSSLGMQLGAVVIVRDSTGCVCHPVPTAPGATASEDSSAAVAGVLIVDEEAEQQRNRQDQMDEQRKRQQEQEQQRQQQQQLQQLHSPDPT